MATMNTADIGFEREIWKAADKMRGNIDASEYKSVVLGLIFLKYISDKFETKYRQLVAEGEGFEEDKDEYTAENIFYVPTEARWERIAAEAHTPEIGQVIDNAMRAIEKENKRLKDILPKNFARPELDKRRLGDVVDLFTNIRMHEHGDSKDILGRAWVLSFEICRGGRETRRRILYARLYCQNAPYASTIKVLINRASVFLSTLQILAILRCETSAFNSSCMRILLSWSLYFSGALFSL